MMSGTLFFVWFPWGWD